MPDQKVVSSNPGDTRQLWVNTLRHSLSLSLSLYIYIYIYNKDYLVVNKDYLVVKAPPRSSTLPTAVLQGKLIVYIYIHIYVTGKLRNQAFREMPKNFSHFLK